MGEAAANAELKEIEAKMAKCTDANRLNELLITKQSALSTFDARACCVCVCVCALIWLTWRWYDACVVHCKTAAFKLLVDQVRALSVESKTWHPTPTLKKPATGRCKECDCEHIELRPMFVRKIRDARGVTGVYVQWYADGDTQRAPAQVEQTGSSKVCVWVCMCACMWSDYSCVRACAPLQVISLGHLCMGCAELMHSGLIVHGKGSYWVTSTWAKSQKHPVGMCWYGNPGTKSPGDLRKDLLMYLKWSMPNS